jgi:hypothetical protein
MAGDSPTFRGRDVEVLLKQVELHPAVKEALMRIAEQSHVNMKGLAELAAMFDQLTGILNEVMSIADNMKTRTDQMARAMGEPPPEPETEN